MPGRFRLTLETPAGAVPTAWEGPILNVLDATVNRAVNKAGNFSVTVPATEAHIQEVYRGWRATIVQERAGGILDSAGAAVDPVPMLWRGRVIRRTPVVTDAGAVVMVLEGETWLGQLADRWIQTEHTFTAQTLSQILTTLLTPLGLSFSVPARCTTATLTITFSDLTYLQALIRLAEYTKTNLRDGWEGVIEFTDQYALPDPAIGLNASDPVLRLVQLERAGPGIAEAGRAGFGIIAGTPQASYDGSELANKIKVIGAEFSGGPLTLEGATYTDPKYTVQTAAGPEENYYYVEDSASIAMYGPVETQIVRSDVKNPGDTPEQRAAARAVLLAIANGELLRRRSEVLAFGSPIANGEDVFALPGDRVWLRYKGNAITRDGRRTVVDVEGWQLVTRRHERAGETGVRIVLLDLASHLIPYDIPNQPDWTAIPTPRDNQLPPDRTAPTEEELADDTGWIEFPPPVDPALVEEILDERTTHGEFQACCADPFVDIGGNPDDDGGVHPPPLNG